MLADILKVIRFEIGNLKSSSRIWVAGLIFIALGLLNSLIYSFVAKEVKLQASNALAGASGVIGQLTIQDQLDQLYGPAILQIVSWTTSCKSSISETALCQNPSSLASECDQQVCQLFNQVINVSPLLLATFWILLIILPFLLSLLSFDMITNDIQYRTLSYPLLRIKRYSWYLGKLGAHVLLGWGLSLLLMLVIMLVGWIILPAFSIGTNLLFIFKCWLLLLPFILAYVALISLCSTLCNTPFISLLLCLGALLACGIFGLFSNISPDGVFSTILSYLPYLSPSNYRSWLWSPGVVNTLKAVSVYLCFGAIFGTATVALLNKRDI